MTTSPTTTKRIATHRLRTTTLESRILDSLLGTQVDVAHIVHVREPPGVIMEICPLGTLCAPGQTSPSMPAKLQAIHNSGI